MESSAETPDVSKLRAVVAALPDLIMVLGREGRCLEIHVTRAENLILPRESLLGRAIPEFLPAPAAALWMEKISACLLTGTPQTLEYPLDVQADLERLTDNMFDVISQLDFAGRCQFVSPSHEIVTGWTSGELLGANALDLIHPDDRELIRAKLARGAVTGKSGTAEYRYRARDGRYLWVETVSNVLCGPDGKPQAFVLGSRDVTARKSAEAVLGVLHETERRILRHEQ